MHAVAAAALGKLVQAQGRSRPAPEYVHWRGNLTGSFRRRISKLLTALAGSSSVNTGSLPSSGNPLSGANAAMPASISTPWALSTPMPRAGTGTSRVTDLARKADYLAWCDVHRLLALRGWARRYQPQLIASTWVGPA